MSFRRRLTLLSAAAVAVAIALVAASSYLLVRSELRSQIDDSLAERASMASAAAERFGAPPGIGPGGGDRPGFDGIAPGRPGGPGPGGELGGPETAGQIVAADGSIIESRGLGDAELPTELAVELLATDERGPVLSDESVEGASLRVASVVIAPDAALQLARSLEEVDSALSRLASILALIAIGGIGVAAALGTVVAGAALAPVRRLTETSEEVARTEDLTQRIEVDGDDELARLGHSFNEMLAALERSVGAQKQLVADASHELRTPLTSLRTNIETLARRPDMPSADRELLLADLESELGELGRLVDDIVDLARDGSEATSEPVELRLDELVAACVERARRRPGPEIRAELAPTLLRGDPERLDRAVGNLLNNALKWAPEGGEVAVTLADGVLSVDDDGPGIADADLPHVFDRFYRAAGARGTPGSGLGLAIVRQVAELHGGDVRAGRSAAGGARFELELPAAEPVPPGA
ncbi:MAG TPA: HAMP domain-containing sensor histidine kinase [Solirubrobacterales bacterium]|nr:HAMP domain-containing sensor histidine kinase [Solirubrobacterales bacterium]